MWIVRLALKRPYTFVVMSILIVIMGTLAIFRTPTDIFPNIDIPVVSIIDRKSTRLNSSHGYISYAVFCLKKKKKKLHNLIDFNYMINRIRSFSVVGSTNSA